MDWVISICVRGTYYSPPPAPLVNLPFDARAVHSRQYLPAPVEYKFGICSWLSKAKLSPGQAALRQFVLAALGAGRELALQDKDFGLGASLVILLLTLRIIRPCLEPPSFMCGPRSSPDSLSWLRG
jgi:hypothetical protein